MRDLIREIRRAFSNFTGKMKRKWNTAKEDIKNSLCYFVYYHRKLDENLVFIESRDGMDFAGNLLRIAQELSREEYSHLKLCVWIDRNLAENFRQMCRRYGIKRTKVIHKEYRAVMAMERAKYIVSDSGVPWRYVKREGQVVLNTWHGTPLKCMGRQVKDEKYLLGTVQHFFLSSDYLLYPSDYMRDVMLRDYMVEHVASGKALMEGYPRNSVFFDKARRELMRRTLGFDGKRVSAYLPTYRGVKSANKNDVRALDEALAYLAELDAYMEEDELLLVKMHIFDQTQVDFAQFTHVKAFPQGYETYDVLNATDCLITDYSSVFFDYANSGQKIILFAYDEAEYFSDRGTYFSLSELPFPKVTEPMALLAEMRTPKEYDDKAFLKRFCTYDAPDAVERLCRHVFKDEKTCKEERFGNGKENVLFFMGSLAKNGITTAAVNLLNRLDLSERNYIAAFRRQDVNGDPGRVEVIPDSVDFLPMMSDQHYTFGERLSYNRYRKKKTAQTKYPQALRRLFRREIDRCYWGVDFSTAIQFDGYGINTALFFLEMDARRIIFVHNDMVQELSKKDNQHRPTLYIAYQQYDAVAVVSDELIAPTATCGAPEDKIVVVNNTHNAQGILSRGRAPVSFEQDTECRTSNPGGIEGVLNAPGKKIITIGRFSPEKGHQRLLRAFDLFCEDYPDAQLIIIGGHGPLYGRVINEVCKMKHWGNVTVIKSIQNPMPILRRCDLFILPSFYEGLPMTIKEADTFGIPVVATDIPGVHGFMKRYNGHLVPDSEEGVLQGLYDFMDGKVRALGIDYDAYDAQALEEFKRLMTGDKEGKA